VSGGEKLHLWSPEGKLLDTCDREEEEGTVLIPRQTGLAFNP
jgi:hypothetical protein